MRAFVTSIGEPTTDLCVWSLKRNGFEVTLIQDNTTLAKKLAVIYNEAQDDFVRVDADVIPNRNLTEANLMVMPDKWWIQYMTFDWFKQDLSNGGVQHIKKEALKVLRDNIGQHLQAERPETEMFRLKEFYEPRRCETNSTIMGLHNYLNDAERVRQTKERRGQLDNYDFELAERINEL